MLKKNELSSVTLFFFHLIYITLGEKSIGFAITSFIFNTYNINKEKHHIGYLTC